MFSIFFLVHYLGVWILLSLSDLTYQNLRIKYTLDTSCQDRCGYHPGLATCRCDPQCKRFQDCCFDYSDVCSPPSEDLNETETIDSVLYTCTPLDRDYPQMGSVLLVNECHSNTNGQIKQRCENLPSIYSDSGERLIVEWPVSNRQGDNFQNLFCALCNGQRFFDVVTWNVIFPSFSPSIAIELKQCITSQQPVLGKRLRYCLISSCPLSPDVNTSYHEY